MAGSLSSPGFRMPKDSLYSRAGSTVRLGQMCTTKLFPIQLPRPGTPDRSQAMLELVRSPSTLTMTVPFVTRPLKPLMVTAESS
eukprot:3936471-Rhodomonas_salina.2